MARGKSFNTEDALDKAIECFWRDGLKAATARELASEIGIASPSLYNAFGCKKGLFSSALERYAQNNMRASLAALLRENSPRNALRLFFIQSLDKVSDRTRLSCCLIINTAIEITQVDDEELRARVSGYLDEIRQFFEKTITNAKADGSIPPQVDARAHAALLLHLLLGLCVLARNGAKRGELEMALKPALSPLGITLQPNH